MIDPQIIAFTLAAGVLTLMPGADTLLVFRNVLRGGRKDGMITTVGICSGLFVHATLSALGVSVILMHSASAFHIVKFAGACYLTWLGVRSLMGAIWPSGDPADTETVARTAGVKASRCFLEGFLSNVFNPKAVVFYLAFLPQFIGPSDPVLTKSLFLAGIHCIEGLLWLVTLSMVLDHTRRFIVQANVRRWLEGACGLLLVGIGVRLTVERG